MSAVWWVYVSRDKVHIREISCRFFVFCLLLSQEAREGDNICVDLLPSYGPAIPVRSHIACETLKGWSTLVGIGTEQEGTVK